MNYELLQIETKINETVADGSDYDKLQSLRRERDLLLSRHEFEKIAQFREQIEKTEADRAVAVAVRADIEAQIRETGRRINAIRDELEQAEAELREQNARAYYLDSQIDGHRRDLLLMRGNLDRQIKSVQTADNGDTNQ